MKGFNIVYKVQVEGNTFLLLESEKGAGQTFYSKKDFDFKYYKKHYKIVHKYRNEQEEVTVDNFYEAVNSLINYVEENVEDVKVRIHLVDNILFTLNDFNGGAAI